MHKLPRGNGYRMWTNMPSATAGCQVNIEHRHQIARALERASAHRRMAILLQQRADHMLPHLWPGGTNDHTARSRYRPDHSAAAAARSRDDDAAERARSAPRARRIARRHSAAARTERKRYGSEGCGRTACRARLSRLG